MIWFFTSHQQSYSYVGLVFLRWTSVLLKDTTQWRRWGSNPRPHGQALYHWATALLKNAVELICILTARSVFPGCIQKRVHYKSFEWALILSVNLKTDNVSTSFFTSLSFVLNLNIWCSVDSEQLVSIKVNWLESALRHSFVINVITPKICLDLNLPRMSERSYDSTLRKYRTVCMYKISGIHVFRNEISSNMVCATSKGSDQPAHMRCLIRATASRLNILWLSKHQLEFLSLKGGCPCWSTLVKMPRFRKSHVAAVFSRTLGVHHFSCFMTADGSAMAQW